MNKPNLFIVGAPKCGTTFMYDYLRQHPEIFMSSQKEPHFFGKDLTRHGTLYALRFNEYMSLFENANAEKIVGEASTFYLYSRSAPYEIHEHNRTPSHNLVL